MNLRRQSRKDSLDMLLDTMCNTFGGIILLAVLVALLAHRERETGGNERQETEAVMQNRLAAAQENLEKSRELEATLRAKAGDPRLKDPVALLTKRTELQQEIELARASAQQDLQTMDTANSANPSDRVKALNGRLAAAQSAAQKLKQALESITDSNSGLRRKLADVNAEATAKINETVRNLRLPKEHETSRRPMYFILRFGHIYQVYLADGTKDSANLKWAFNRASETPEPIEGRGMDPARDPVGVRTFFSSLPRDRFYVVFLVYEDSFGPFIYAKQMAVDMGLEFGWEPYRIEDGPVSFSAFGSSTSAQ